MNIINNINKVILANKDNFVVDLLREIDEGQGDFEKFFFKAKNILSEFKYSLQGTTQDDFSFYRGTTLTSSKSPIILYDPSKRITKRATTCNYKELLYVLEYNESFKYLPSRLKSLLFTDDREHAEFFNNNIAFVFPINGANLGVAQNDFNINSLSFVRQELKRRVDSHYDLFSYIKEVNPDKLEKFLYKNGYPAISDYIATLSEKYKNILNVDSIRNYGSYFVSFYVVQEILNDFKDEVVFDNVFDWILEKTRGSENRYAIMKEKLSKILKKCDKNDIPNTIYKIFEQIGKEDLKNVKMDADFTTNLRKLKFLNMVSDKKKEYWTENKCLLIDENFFEEINDQLTEFVSTL